MYRRSEDRALLAAATLEEFLAEQFKANRPWSEIVSAFITASGPPIKIVEGRSSVIEAFA